MKCALVPVAAAVAAAFGRLGLTAGRDAPGHAGFEVDGIVAEGDVDDEPLVENLVDGGRDLLLEESETRVAELIDLAPLHERNDRVAGAAFEFRPLLREFRLAVLRHDAIQM